MYLEVLEHAGECLTTGYPWEGQSYDLCHLPYSFCKV